MSGYEAKSPQSSEEPADFDEWKRQRAEAQYKVGELFNLFGLDDGLQNPKSDRRQFELYQRSRMKAARPQSRLEDKSSPEATRLETSTCCGGGGATGCSIKHGSIHFAETVNQQSGKFDYIPIAEDTQTTPNWIPEALVAHYGFQTKRVQLSIAYRDFQGVAWEPRQVVSIPIGGKGMPKTKQVAFFVAPPSFPGEHLLVGTDFIEHHGHVYILFREKREGAIHIMTETKLTEAEKQKQAADQVRAAAEIKKLQERKEEFKKQNSEAKKRQNRQQPSVATSEASSSRRKP